MAPSGAHFTRETIRHFMARAFFASAWADQCEETGNARILSGREILNLIPSEFDPAAWHAADTLIFDLESSNNGKPVETLYADALKQNPIAVSEFGHYCAMESMGHGVGLFDYGIDCVNVPYVEFGSHSLQKDYF
jgi:hypothetical protein